MSEFQKIEKIHRYSTRVIANAGTVDTYGDFVFNSTGKNVPLGTPYHIHYLENPQQEIISEVPGNAPIIGRPSQENPIIPVHS